MIAKKLEEVKQDIMTKTNRGVRPKKEETEYMMALTRNKGQIESSI